MMKPITPYLVFPGNCREAMNFYQKVFDGDISIMMTFGDSPIQVPVESRDRIFNSELVTGDFRIKASDDMPGYKIRQGTNVSLFVTFDSEKKKKEIFDGLAKGGTVQFPIEDNFGMVKDRYGIQWMVTHE